MSIRNISVAILIALMLPFAFASPTGSIENTLDKSNLWEEHEEKERHVANFDVFQKEGMVERNWTLEPKPQSWSTESPGIYEVTRYPSVNPNLRDLEQAWDLYSRVYNAVKSNNWEDYAEAREDNFTFRSDSLHRGNRRYLFDNETFNPQKPEYLIYYNQSGQMKLVGIMFLANDMFDEPPAEYGGPLTLWHYHRYSEYHPCFEKNVLLRELDKCEWDRYYRTPEMLHVWLVKHPYSQFGSKMSLPESVINYEKLDKLSKTEFVNQELSNGWFAYGN